MIPVWPLPELPRALGEVAAALGRPRRDTAALPDGLDERALDRWVTSAGAWLGVEPVAVVAPLSQLGASLRRMAPALVRVGDGVVVLLGDEALTPDGRRVPVPWAALEEALAEPVTRPLRPEVEATVTAAGVPEAQRAAATEALLKARLGERPTTLGWFVRLAVTAEPAALAREAGLSGLAAEVVVLHALQVALVLGGWALVGQATLGGSFEPGQLAGWAVSLLCLVPLRMRESALQGRLAIAIGAVLKRRMLRGALSLDPSAVRAEGLGSLLGRVSEADQVEQLGVQAALVSAVSAIELAAAAWVLSQGAAGAAHALALGAWIGVVGWLAWRAHQARSAWTDQRLATTHTLVEQMAGHRTRLVQEPAHRWHDGDDALLAEGWRRAAELDPRQVALRSLAARGWMVVAVLVLAPALLAGESPGGLAVGIGGTLLAAGALDGLATALTAASGAVIAWRQLGPLASARWAPATRPHGPPPADGPVVEARELVFRHAGRPRAVLQGCDLTIARGDRVLLEGPSGGGKSTLASLLVGLRAPDSGLLLLHGLDLATLGEGGWRRAAAAAPQFHENHVLTETFAFNLLLGRTWPPSADDVRLAGEVCAELGLDDVLARMPGGIWQLVGETGWQLSHGEQSRLFLARALLQDAELVVLDETFAALDPPNLARALAAARRRAKTLVVVAHP